MSARLCPPPGGPPLHIPFRIRSVFTLPQAGPPQEAERKPPQAQAAVAPREVAAAPREVAAALAEVVAAAAAAGDPPAGVSWGVSWGVC